MRCALLDVNALLALLDVDHAHTGSPPPGSTQRCGAGGRPARSRRTASSGSSASRAAPARSQQPPQPALARACTEDAHEFWSCDVSLVDPAVADVSRLLGPKQVTDTYLLALAVAHGGRLVTFDEHVALTAVVGATEDRLTVL